MHIVFSIWRIRSRKNSIEYNNNLIDPVYDGNFRLARCVGAWCSISTLRIPRHVYTTDYRGVSFQISARNDAIFDICRLPIFFRIKFVYVTLLIFRARNMTAALLRRLRNATSETKLVNARRLRIVNNRNNDTTPLIIRRNSWTADLVSAVRVGTHTRRLYTGLTCRMKLYEKKKTSGRAIENVITSRISIRDEVKLINTVSYWTNVCYFERIYV